MTPVRLLLGSLLALLALASEALAADGLTVRWEPTKPRVGDVAFMHLRGVPEGATVEGMVDGRPLAFFPYAGGYAALLGFDLEVKPGVKPWQLAVLQPDRDPIAIKG